MNIQSWKDFVNIRLQEDAVILDISRSSELMSDPLLSSEYHSIPRFNLFHTSLSDFQIIGCKHLSDNFVQYRMRNVGHK